MKDTIHELAETETANIRGASGTMYGLQPVKFLQEVVTAAKNQFFFANFAKIVNLEPGVRQVQIPKKTKYEGNSGMTWNTTGSDSHGTGTGTGPYANTIADISWTTHDTNTSVLAEPLSHIAGYAIRRYDIRTNIVNLVEDAREELSYAIGDRVDVQIAQLFGSADGVTYAIAGTNGTTVLYGGDATTDASLETGDVLTTDLVATAAKHLKTTENWIRATAGKSGAFSLDTTATKNPWTNTSGEPFVLFIGPHQEEALRKDSQFVNAAEYGSDTVVQNGEIGMYLGVRVVVTNNVESFAAAATGPDDTTVPSALSNGMTRCVMLKAKKAMAVVWGMQPEIKVFEYLTRDQIRIALFSAYISKIVHSDSIVVLDVANA